MYSLIMYILMLFLNLYDRQYNLSAINSPEMGWGQALARKLTIHFTHLIRYQAKLILLIAND